MINTKYSDLHGYYQISLKELAFYLGITKSHNAKHQVIKALKKLNKAPVMLSPNLMVYWISSVEFLENGLVEFEFSKKLREHLNGASFKEKKIPFTMYYLYNVLPLQTQHSIRIYELLIQFWPKIPERTFELKDLKGKIGIKPTAYARWSDFSRKVLEVAKKEIYEQTDIGVNFFPESRLKGKAVTHVRCIMYSSPNNRAKLWMEQENAVMELANKKNAFFSKDVPQLSKNSPAYDKALETFNKNRKNIPVNTIKEWIGMMGKYQVVKRGHGWDLKSVGQQRLV
jgi:hypothetical protein